MAVEGRELGQGRGEGGDEGVDPLAEAKEIVLGIESMRRRLAGYDAGVSGFLDFIGRERQVLNMRIPRGAPEDHPDKVVVRACRDVERALNADGGEKLFVELLMKSRALMEIDEVVEESVRVSTETVPPQEQEKKKGGWRFWRR